MVKKEDKNYYVADFETLVLTKEEIEAGKRTYVWAWAICDVKNIESVAYGTDIKSFINSISKLKSGSTVYFHNLKFDGNFIVSYLLENGYTWTNNKKMEDKTFQAFVNELGTWYSIRIRFGKKTININDSLKKLPFKVSVIAKQLGFEEEKGCIDYKAYRAEGGKLSDEDKDYIRRDVQIVAKALKEVCFSKDMYKMTIGSDCMAWYKDHFPKFDKFFPELPEQVDFDIRQAYKGGFCYVNKKYAGRRLKHTGYTYDYNSMYPSVMHSQSGYTYPVGKPIYFTGEYEKDVMHPLYIQHFKALFSVKENKVPTVQIKGTVMYNEHEYIEEVQELTELWMTNVDLEIFFDHYDVFEIEFIDGYKFSALKGMFDEYINYWYKFKEEATIKKDKVGRMVAKLMLNNLYGKFATSTDSTTQEFYLADNGMLRHYNNYATKSGIYIPVACFITSYARKELMEAIDNNMDAYCYSDTDSIHLLDKAKGIRIHDSALGYWKEESTWTDAKFIRQKTYAELIDGKWDIKAAGASDDVKAYITDIDKFDIGAVYPGKKIPTKAKGGIVLLDGTFSII